jgi:hypothetical protein
LAEFLVLAFALFTLSLKLTNLFLELSLLLSKILDLLIGGRDDLFPGLEFFKKLLMVLFSLE